tara:strand:+ start:4031 stop:4213 length:183 start_codon:yes stop_codon:yes gene_type:complete
MKFKQEVEQALEVAENLALTLETVASTPRLSNPVEIKRLATAIRNHIKKAADRVSLEYEG